MTRRPRAALVLLVPALLLAGCGQTALPVQPTTPAPGSPAGGTITAIDGVYEVSFQNVGSAGFSARAQTLGGLRSQGLVAAPEQFTFTPLAVQTFAVGDTQTRHIQATFRVTNGSALTLTNLKFLPVVTNDNPTGTTFKNVTLYDGTDVSASKAGSLQSTQGQNYDASTQKAVVDPATNAYLTGLDTSGVDTAGRNIKVLENYGWQVADSLAPGASAVMTFAVDLPLDPQGSKYDPFNFSLTFTSVQDAPPVMTSAVQQYNRTAKRFGNYTQFPTLSYNDASGAGVTHSLPAYYDLTNIGSGGAVLCAGDANLSVTRTNIDTQAFPNRYRVETLSPGDHALNVYAGSTCPAPGATGALTTQTVTGVAPQTNTLAAGNVHGLAVLAGSASAQTAQAWGSNASGRLGDSTTTSRPSPTAVSNFTGAVGVAGGYAHSVGLKADGTVFAWGDNSYNQLGNGIGGATGSRTTPGPVSGVAGAVSVASGQYHSLALLADGTVMAWGNNSKGQLGNGTTTAALTAVKVTDTQMKDVVGVAAGQYHSLALLADGTVMAWGSNNGGQLGTGSSADTAVPVRVVNLGGVAGLAAGASHSLALRGDGTVMAWGINSLGQLGNGTSTSTRPLPVTNLMDVMNVGAGDNHSLAVKSDGTVVAWGSNSRGQLGNGATSTSSNNKPTAVPNVSGAVVVVGSASSSLALKSDGTVVGWGNNGSGQLGTGASSTTAVTTPVTTQLGGVAQPTP